MSDAPQHHFLVFQDNGRSTMDEIEVHTASLLDILPALVVFLHFFLRPRGLHSFSKLERIQQLNQRLVCLRRLRLLGTVYIP